LSDESDADHALLVDPLLQWIICNTEALGVGALASKAERMRRHATRTVHGFIIRVLLLVVRTTALVHDYLAIQTDVFITLCADFEGLSFDYEEALAFRSRTFLVSLLIGQGTVFSLSGQLFILFAHGLVFTELDGAGVRNDLAAHGYRASEVNVFYHVDVLLQNEI